MYYFINYRLLSTSPGMSDDAKEMLAAGYAHIAFSAGNKEQVDILTERLIKTMLININITINTVFNTATSLKPPAFVPAQNFFYSPDVWLSCFW